MLVILICSILSTAPFEASLRTDTTPRCWIDRGLGRAPANNLVLDLPLVQAADGGYLFPPDTTSEVLRRLRCLELWPEAAQIALNEQAQVLTAPPPVVKKGVRWETVVIISGSAALVGLVVGFVAGAVGGGS
jgi:hypothetical protein